MPTANTEPGRGTGALRSASSTVVPAPVVPWPQSVVASRQWPASSAIGSLGRAPPDMVATSWTRPSARKAARPPALASRISAVNHHIRSAAVPATDGPEARLAALGIELPGPHPPHDPLVAVLVHAGRGRPS